LFLPSSISYSFGFVPPVISKIKELSNMTNTKKDQDLAEEALDKVNSEPGAGSTKSKQKCRHRASVACASCRDRRIRVRLFHSSTRSGSC
jgi:hypothetical protein